MARSARGVQKRGGLAPCPFWLAYAAALALIAPANAQSAAEPDLAEVTCAQAIGAGPLIWRMERLEAAKIAVDANDPAVMAAYWRLIAEAEEALMRGPYTVTDKQRPPPSGDRHDYTSLAPYWWPDPSTPDGRPYQRRDGEVNPEREGVNFDRRRSQNMADDVTTLALAAYFSGDARYADHADMLLSTWFVAADTRMNPNLNFGQSIPGRTDGRGIGIIDTSFYVPVVDSARLLSAMDALSPETYAGLQEWFLEYTRWLITSPLGLDERAAKNNHGAYYDLQLAAFALMAGDCSIPQQVMNDAKARLEAQIVEGGRMPLEERRTRSLHYYIFNAQAFLHIARLAERFGENLYTYKGDEGAGLLETLMLLLPYAGAEEDWPHQMIGRSADRDLWRLIRQAETIYAADAFEAAEARASGRDPADRIILLTHQPDGEP